MNKSQEMAMICHADRSMEMHNKKKEKEQGSRIHIYDKNRNKGKVERQFISLSSITCLYEPQLQFEGEVKL